MKSETLKALAHVGDLIDKFDTKNAEEAKQVEPVFRPTLERRTREVRQAFAAVVSACQEVEGT